MDPLNFLHSSCVLKRRAGVLSDHLARLLPANSTVLDIGSGDGLLAYMLQKRRRDLEIHGIDVLRREKAYIPVRLFNGINIPYERDSFHFALLIDILHHTDDPMLLLREADRIASRGVIIKDHVTTGWFSWYTLCLMDWVGNARYSVRLPYNYWTEAQWREATAQLGWKTNQWEHDLGLYPKPADFVFGGRLHFIGRFTPAVSATDSKPEQGAAKSEERTEC